MASASNDRMSAQLSLHRTIDRGQVVRFSVAGEIDISVAGMFRDALMAALHRRRVTMVIVDLGPLRFMDSSGARVLTDVRREADRRDVAVVVVNAHGPARTILTVLDLYDELVLFSASTRDHFAITGKVVLAYLGVSALHGLWDSMHSIALILTLLLTEPQYVPTPHGWLVRAAPEQLTLLPILDWTGLVLISIVGLAWLVLQWRRTPRGERSFGWRMATRARAV